MAFMFLKPKISLRGWNIESIEDIQGTVITVPGGLSAIFLCKAELVTYIACIKSKCKYFHFILHNFSVYLNVLSQEEHKATSSWAGNYWLRKSANLNDHFFALLVYIVIVCATAGRDREAEWFGST